MVGDGVLKLVDRTLTARGLRRDHIEQALARYLALYEARPALLSRPYPGVTEVLPRLAAEGWRFALCTNKPSRLTGLVLRALGLDGCFGAVIAGDTLPARKPDPA